MKNKGISGDHYSSIKDVRNQAVSGDFHRSSIKDIRNRGVSGSKLSSVKDVRNRGVSGS